MQGIFDRLSIRFLLLFDTLRRLPRRARCLPAGVLFRSHLIRQVVLVDIPDVVRSLRPNLAGGDEFRTAPLWGLGQRLFLLHDGRTSDLMAAIAREGVAAGHRGIRSGVPCSLRAIPDNSCWNGIWEGHL